MKTWIALLRAVNVGGRNKLPMKALASLLEELGLSDVSTYIQSGNVVFRGPAAKPAALAAQIGAAINARFGFEPQVALIGAKEFAAAATANPFPDATTDTEGRLLHLFFLAEAPRDIDARRLDAVRRPSERWKVKGSVLYMHTPEGLGNSKLGAQVERILGVAATARNWRTVCALLDLAKPANR